MGKGGSGWGGEFSRSGLLIWGFGFGFWMGMEIGNIAEGDGESDVEDGVVVVFQVLRIQLHDRLESGLCRSACDFL